MIDLRLGDCFELLKQLEDNSIDLIITDPPYQMQRGGTGSSSELLDRLSNRQLELRNRGLMNFGREQILSLANEFKRIQSKINLFVFCSKEQVRYWYEAFPELSPYILFWGKTNPAPVFNGVLLPNAEYILWFKESGVKVYTTYQNASRYDITAINQKDKHLYNHPTIKPVQILERYIDIASSEGQIILDPFMGSGSTGVACINKGRNFIGIEIDNNYFNIASERIKKAMTERNGGLL